MMQYISRNTKNVVKNCLWFDHFVTSTCKIHHARQNIMHFYNDHQNDANVNCDYRLLSRNYSNSENQSIKVNQIHGTIPLRGKGVAIGQYAELQRRFTVDDVEQYSNLSGDNNSLHQSWNIDNIPAELQDHILLEVDQSTIMKNDSTTNSLFTKVVVHGMLVSSIFSCIFGTLIPGAIYLKQSLDFRKPVHVNDPVVGCVKITRIRHFPSRGGLILTCETKIYAADNETKIYVRGEADVLALSGEAKQ